MKNRLSKILCVMLSCLCLFSVFSLTACQKDPDPYNLAGKWKYASDDPLLVDVVREYKIENGKLVDNKGEEFIKFEEQSDGTIKCISEYGYFFYDPVNDWIANSLGTFDEHLERVKE